MKEKLRRSEAGKLRRLEGEKIRKIKRGASQIEVGDKKRAERERLIKAESRKSTVFWWAQSL